MGYLPEHLALPPAWSAAAFLRSIARLKRVPLTARALERQLARVGLEAERNVKIRTFSKGMKQRLGLAAALLGEPELLVLDEPTDGVDPIGRAAIRDLLKEERARGATLFLNSHLLSETERICDRVGILHGGRLIKEGLIEALAITKNRWRALFSAGDPAPILAAGFTAGSEPGAFTLEAEGEAELNAALDRARAGGALLIRLGRETRSLEDLLRAEVGG